MAEINVKELSADLRKSIQALKVKGELGSSGVVTQASNRPG